MGKVKKSSRQTIAKNVENGPQATTGFATLAFANGPVSAGDTPPAPNSPGDTYLLALLATQKALKAALDALSARASVADAEETDFIDIQKGLIKADYLKIDSQIGAYLSNQTIFKAITEQELKLIREILNRIQSFTAKVNKASAIVDAVTELLNKWNA